MKFKNNLKIEHDCETCQLRSENFFCHLRDTNIKLFDSLKVTHTYPKGSTLFSQEDKSDGVYILCQGRIKLSSCSKDGKVIILHVAEPGEILGLSTSFTDSVHIATAEILEDSQVNFIRNKDFHAFLTQNVEACLSAVRQLSKNYQSAYLRICSLGLSSSVADKLAMLFLGWCKTTSFDDHESVHLKVTYTHEELAQMIGTSRETVTRVLKRFRDRHLVTLKGSNLTIHDKSKLEDSIGTRPDPKG